MATGVRDATGLMSPSPFGMPTEMIIIIKIKITAKMAVSNVNGYLTILAKNISQNKYLGEKTLHVACLDLN